MVALPSLLHPQLQRAINRTRVRGRSRTVMMRRRMIMMVMTVMY